MTGARVLRRPARSAWDEDGTPSMQLYATTVHCFSTNCAQHDKNIDAIDFIL
jgi:hypothetical protein